MTDFHRSLDAALERAHTAEKDAGQYQPCCAECNGCPACDPGLASEMRRVTPPGEGREVRP